MRVLKNKVFWACQGTSSKLMILHTLTFKKGCCWLQEKSHSITGISIYFPALNFFVEGYLCRSKTQNLSQKIVGLTSKIFATNFKPGC